MGAIEKKKSSIEILIFKNGEDAPGSGVNIQPKTNLTVHKYTITQDIDSSNNIRRRNTNNVKQSTIKEKT